MFYYRLCYSLFGILAFGLLFSFYSQGQTENQTGRIIGTVYERGGRFAKQTAEQSEQNSVNSEAVPLSGVTVTISELRRSESTDSSGGFTFENIPLGKYSITATAVGYDKSDGYEVTVESGRSTYIAIYLRRTSFVLDEVVIKTRRMPQVISRQTMLSNEIKRLPGAAGDALRALQALPGIGVMNDFSGLLYIRGGGPEDNVFYFDRTYLLYPYHFGGFVATVNSEIIDKVDVYAGGFGAEFGTGAQAVIDIYARDGRDDRVGVKANVNMLMSEALVEGPIGERGSWYLAGRRSYIDLFPIKVEQITAFPRFWDYQAKLSYAVTKNHHLSFDAFGADDFMELHIKDENVRYYSQFAGRFHYKSGFHAQSLHLKSRLSSKLTSVLSCAHTPYLMDLGFGEGYFLRVEPDMYGVRNDLEYSLNPRSKIEAGFVSATGMIGVKSFFSRPPEEGQAEYDFLADTFKSDTKKRFTYIEGYIQERYAPVKPINLILGARAEHFNLTDEISLQGRGNISLNLFNNLDLRFAWGRYFQSPQALQILPDWGNPAVTDSKATHYIVEAERQLYTPPLTGGLGGDTILKVAGYYKKLSDLITNDPKYIYLNQGEGFARGVEVFLKHSIPDKFFGWLSYTYSVSRRRDKPDEPERLYSYDQTHVITLTGNYKLTPTWEIGAKWHYSTGTPYTPIIDSTKVYDPKAGRVRYYAIYGEVNSERLLPYHSLNISVNKTFIFKRWRLSTYLEILNAYNRKNVLSIEYNDDYSEQEPVYQLPIIPYLGVKMEF
ncbi:TonB-dependent receptor [Candidatus Poribacteria bacterium]|nr:TonB-dependent receptor [Candidatus Poribacteria bacterium]